MAESLSRQNSAMEPISSTKPAGHSAAGSGSAPLSAGGVKSIPGGDMELRSDVRMPPTKLYENTYRMIPSVKFNSPAVTKIIEAVLEDELKEERYEHVASKQMSKTLASIIQQKIKDLNFERYKIVTIVNIGEKNEQGIRIASRCLWNTDTDTSASATFKNSSLFAVGMVFGLYYE